MKSKILFSILLLLSTYEALHSQTLLGSVTDSAYNTIGYATIEDTISKRKVTSDFSGNFVLMLNEASVIKISHPEYKSQTFPISRSGDTLVMNFILKRKVQLIEEVFITSKRIKKVTDQKNTNIVDYLPFENYNLVLKSFKSEKIVSLEGVDTTFQMFRLGDIKARSIVEDCFGNAHLLTKDSSYQIWIDSNLHIISTSTIEKFNEFLKPCVADFKDSTVFYDFSNYNRKYTLTTINKTTKKRSALFDLRDRVGESVARSYYHSIISYYYQNKPIHENMIELGVWDGNLLSLNLYDPDFEQMISWYLKIRAVELNIESFQDENKLIVFNQFADSIHIFDTASNDSKSIPYSFAKGPTVFPVIQDRFKNIFYDVSIDDGVYTLTAINPAYDTTIQPRELTISEVPFASNIKIYNDWVYFLVEENRYYGLYRIKMPISSP